MTANRDRLRVVGGDPLGGDPLPHDITAEQAVLGAVMLSPAALAEARKVLDGSEFYRPAHRDHYWDAITTLADRGSPCNPLAVSTFLGPARLAKAGGADYLHTLTAAAIADAGAVAYHARTVRELAYARQVIEAAGRMSGAAWASGGDPGGLRGVVTAEYTALAEASRHGWPDPLPLSAAPEVPAFPLWALPEWLGEYAASVAEVTQTPPDLAGSLALAVLSTAASGKAWIQPRPGWTEPSCLYVVVALPPGERKSEVFRQMTAPVRKAEKALIEAARPRIAEAAIRRRIAEAEAERTEKAATKAAADPVPAAPDRAAAALVDAIEARIDLDAAEVPAEPCLFGDDTTIEALSTLVAEQGGRFAVLSPEGEIFAIAGGRYSGTPNLGILKSGHAGEATRVNRRGRSEHLDAATLTLGVATQPGVLARLGDTPQFAEQGFLARILYSVPESLLGYRDPAPAPMSPVARDLYDATVTTLVLSLHDLPEPRVIGFDAAASQAVTSLLGANEPRFRPDGDLYHMRDWGGKLTGATVRIAGLLHLAAHARDGWDRPITTATVEAAAELSRYYTEHAKAAYDLIGADPALAAARTVLTWLRRNQPAQVTTRDLMRGMQKLFTKAADLTPAMSILQSRGWVRPQPPPRAPGRGHHAGATWEVHPGIGDHP